MQNNKKEIYVPGWLTPSGERNYTSVIMGCNDLARFGVFDGDILIIKKCKPNANDFVFATLGDKKVIRKLIEIDGTMYLQSTDPTVPIEETNEKFILGKVTALIRDNFVLGSTPVCLK